MRKLSAFNTVSLDGYFTGANNDLSWAHGGDNDAEWNEFVSGNARSDGSLVFGRITYREMEQFWPTPAAMESMPDVARGMNRMEKIVFSRTIKNPTWNNTKVVTEDPATAMKKIKSGEGIDMVILGSGTIVALLTAAGLIDEYSFVVKPVILGAGRTMFEGVSNAPKLKRTDSRTFKNGNVVLTYALLR